MADAAPAAAGPRSLRDLRGVGPELARKLAALDIRTPADLARTYPRAYRDWRAAPPIAEIVRRALAHAPSGADAQTLEEIAVANVVSVREVRHRIAVVSVELDDGSGTMRATWFGRRGFSGKLAPGDRVFVHGRVALRRGRGALGAEMNVLHHRILRPASPTRARSSRSTPRRRICRRARSARRSRRTSTGSISERADALPPALARKHGFPPPPKRGSACTRRASPRDAARAHERIIFEEFFGDRARRRAQARAARSRRRAPR